MIYWGGYPGLEMVAVIFESIILPANLLWWFPSFEN